MRLKLLKIVLFSLSLNSCKNYYYFLREESNINKNFIYGCGYSGGNLTQSVEALFQVNYSEKYKDYYYILVLSEIDSISYNEQFIKAFKNDIYYLIYLEDEKIKELTSNTFQEYKTILKKKLVPDSLVFKQIIELNCPDMTRYRNKEYFNKLDSIKEKKIK